MPASSHGVTDAEIADAAGVHQSTVSRWSKREGFPPRVHHRRLRSDVLDHLDGMPINRRVVDSEERKRTMPWVSRPEGPRATYGDRARARWGLAVHDRSLPQMAATSSETQRVFSFVDAVEEVLKPTWNDRSVVGRKNGGGRSARAPALLWVAGTLLVHHDVGRGGWDTLNSTQGDDAIGAVEARLQQLLSGRSGPPGGPKRWPKAGNSELGQSLFAAVHDAVSNTRFAEGSEGELLDDLLAAASRWDQGPFFNAEYYTPRAVADLMAQIAAFPEARRWWVPACGTGELVWSALRHSGQDFRLIAGTENQWSAQLTWVGQALRSTTAQVSVRVDGNNQDKRFDVIVTNPPSSSSRHPQLPPKSRTGLKSAYVWLDLVRAIMSDTSRAVIVMPRSAASSQSSHERLKRKDLLMQGLLRAVLHFPRGVFPQSDAPMSVWVLMRRPQVADQMVLVVDAAALTRSSGAKRSVNPALAEGLAEAVSTWLRGGGWLSPPEVQSSLMRASDLCAKDNVSVLLGYGGPPGDALVVTRSASKGVKDSVKQLRPAGEKLLQILENTPDLDWLESPDHICYAQLHEVCKLQAGPSNQIQADAIVRHAGDDAVAMIEPELIGRDGTIDEYATAWWRGPINERYLTRPQDVLMTRVGNRPRLALVSDVQGGWIQGRGCLRLRVFSEDLDPLFLLAYLRQKATLERLSAISTNTLSPSISVGSIRSIWVPVLSLERQRAYVKAAATYRELQAVAEEVADRARNAADDVLHHLLPGGSDVSG